MTRIRQLRKFFKYTQDKLARLLNVSRSTVAMWETSEQEPDYETLKRISLIFDVPPDFILGIGIFANWDDVVKYYESVACVFRCTIPATLKMPSFCEDKFLVAWLDGFLYFEPDEFQLVRWFNFAISEISITPCEDTLYGELDAHVTVQYTKEFRALMDAESRQIIQKNRTSAQNAGVTIPVLGDVSAGIPIEAITDIIDYEEINAAMAASGEFFGLRIKGASMEPRMREGDVVIVRKQDTADTGDTVVVLVNGDSATVKKIRYGPDGVTLLPSNPSYDPIFYSAKEVQQLPVRVIGRVVELRAKY